MNQRPHNQTRATKAFSSTLNKAVLILAVLPLFSMSACQKTLLKKDDARSPFDRYNQTRAQHAPPFLEDEYGRRTPNLRDRLVKSEE